MVKPSLFCSRSSLYLAFLFSPIAVLGQQPSTTFVSASPTTATGGQPVTIGATVAGQTNTTPIPTGSVSFYDDTTNLGSANLSSEAITTPKFMSFAQAFGSSVHTVPNLSTWSDVNGDGKQDLIAYFAYIGIQVFLNQGNGAFTALTPQNFGSQSPLVQSFVPIDFNGDGKTDIVFLAGLTGAVQVQVAYGNGDGTFQSPIPAPGITVNANSLATAVLSASGLPDLILGQNAVSPANASIAVYKNNGSGSFSSLGSFPLASSTMSSQTIIQILAVDLTEDGRLDLAVAILNGNSVTGNTMVSVLRNQGDGTFAPPITSLAGSDCAEYVCASAVVAGDFASRNKTDLAVLDSTGVELYPGNGDGTFSTAVHLNILGSAGRAPFPLGVNQLIAEDINGDGKLDIIECGGYAYLGNGDFSFTPTANLLNAGINQIKKWTEGGTGQTVLLGDVDGDGIPDLLFSYEGGIMNDFDSLVQFGSRNAVASLPATSNLAGGVHPIVARYPGDSNFSASTSSALNVTVNKVVTTTIAVSATPNPALTTQPVTLTVKVNSTGPVPTGSVTVTDGSTPLGTITLNTQGAGALNVTISTAASHNITFSYSGDAFSQPSNTSATVVTVANFPSQISLAASPNPVLVGQSIMLSVVVTPTGSSPTPTGNVIFLAGSTRLGSAALDSSGKATFSTSFSEVGNQTVTANYVGDSANQPSSAPMVVAVLSAFDFQPAGGNATITVSRGSTATSPISITSQNGFSGNVSFACSNLPVSVTCSFSPANVTVSASTPGSVSLTISVPSNFSAASFFKDELHRNIFEATLSLGCLFFLFPAKQSKRKNGRYLFCTLFAIAAIGLSGCGGSSSSGSKTPTTSSFNVVVTSGSVAKTVSYSLVIQ